ELAGVVFGKVVPGDSLFVFVTLPNGWKKVPTDHSMWSNLVDDKGRKRAAIFYKAAFYDRDAHLRMEQRFGTRTDYAHPDAHNAIKVDVTDGDQVVFSTVPRSFVEQYSPEYYKASDAADAEARAWLDEHYPDWQSDSAYWD